MEDISENDPKRGNIQLLGVLGSFHFCINVDFAFPDRSQLSYGGYRRISPSMLISFLNIMVWCRLHGQTSLSQRTGTRRGCTVKGFYGRRALFCPKKGS